MGVQKRDPRTFPRFAVKKECVARCSESLHFSDLICTCFSLKVSAMRAKFGEPIFGVAYEIEYHRYMHIIYGTHMVFLAALPP